MSLNVTSNIGVIGYNNTNTSKNGFVAVAGTSEYSAYSTDGINWTDFKISDSMNIYWSLIGGSHFFKNKPITTNTKPSKITSIVISIFITFFINK